MYSVKMEAKTFGLSQYHFASDSLEVEFPERSMLAAFAMDDEIMEEFMEHPHNYWFYKSQVTDLPLNISSFNSSAVNSLVVQHAALTKLLLPHTELSF